MVFLGIEKTRSEAPGIQHHQPPNPQLYMDSLRAPERRKMLIEIKNIRPEFTSSDEEII